MSNFYLNAKQKYWNVVTYNIPGTYYFTKSPTYDFFSDLPSAPSTIEM